MADENNALQATILATVKPGDTPYGIVSRTLASYFGLDENDDKSLINRTTHDAIPEILKLNNTSANELRPGQEIKIPTETLYKHLSAQGTVEEKSVKTPQTKAPEPQSISQSANTAFPDQAFQTTNIPGTNHVIKRGDNYERAVKAHLAASPDLKKLSAKEQHDITTQLIKKTEQLNVTNPEKLQLEQTIIIPGVSHERFQNHPPKQNYTPTDNDYTVAENIDALITQTMQHSHIPEGLFRALLLSESGGDPKTINSTSGAMGLGQLIPSTAYSTAYEYVHSQDYKDALALGHEQRNETLETLAVNIVKKGSKYTLKDGFSKEDAKKAVMDPATNLTLSREHLKNALSLTRNYLPSEYQDKELNLLDIKFIYMCGSKGGAGLIRAKEQGKLSDNVDTHLKGTPFTNNKNFFLEKEEPLTIGQAFDKMREVLRNKLQADPDGPNAQTAPADLDNYKSKITIDKDNLQPQISLEHDVTMDNIAQQSPPDFGKFT